MQTADTIGQRLDALFQQQDRIITIDDLLRAAKDPGELNSIAFAWAVFKLVWRLDCKSQEFRDLQDFGRGVGRYGCCTPKSYAACLACNIDIFRHLAAAYSKSP